MVIDKISDDSASEVRNNWLLSSVTKI